MASGRKLVIKATDAVSRIRSDMTDTALMRLYSISARGLESLFTKLVAAEMISEAELERRVAASTLSHVVDLDSYKPLAREKGRVRIHTSEAVKLIRSGMGDAALMERFGISTRGLNSLFRKLVAAQAITQEDLDERKHALQWAEVAFIDIEECYPEPVDNSDTSLQTDTRFIVEAFRRHKMQVGLVLGFILGILACVSVYFSLPGLMPVRDSARIESPSHQAAAPDATIELEAEHLIKVLESLARDEENQAKGEVKTTRSEFQECMKKCDKEFPDPGETDRILLFNCRKACIV